MIETVAGNLYDQLIQEGIEKGIEEGSERERMILLLEDKIHLLDKLFSKDFSVEIMADISGLSSDFVQDFKTAYSNEKVAGLTTSIANARNLQSSGDVESYLVRQLAAYGFSIAALVSYFGKTEKDLEQMLK